MSRSAISKTKVRKHSHSHLPDVELENNPRHNARPSKQVEKPQVEKPKSAKELELERILFGGADAFSANFEEENQALTQYRGDQNGDVWQGHKGHIGDDIEEIENDSGEDGALANLTDDQLFSWDAAGDSANPSANPDLSGQSIKSKPSTEDAPAWEDSDDERLVVSLASQTRLRKLRITEEEDVIDGREYSQRLRQQFERLHPAPAWAQASKHRKKRRRMSQNSGVGDSEVSISDDDEDSEETISADPLARLLQSSESLTFDTGSTTDSLHLRSGTIDMRRLRDVGDPQPSTIETLSFHPTVSPPLLLSSGPSGLLSMYHISSATSASSSDPLNNPLLTSLYVRRLGISTALFHPSGSRIFFGGRRRYFHIWDLPTGAVSRVSRFAGNQETQRSCERFALSPCGRYMALVGTSRKGGGCVNILDATTGQWIAQARVEGRGGVIDLAWWGDGEGLVILGKSGEVVEYNIDEKRVVARWNDQGAVGSTVIALGGRLANYSGSSKLLGPSRWVAVGSQSGIVNVYDRAQWSRNKLSENPEPKKVLEQLTTPTSHLQFTPDGQALAMASRWKKDALRLVHLPSCSVYKNWPTSNTPLGRISSISWAPNSRLLAVGNEAGKIRLYEVRG